MNFLTNIKLLAFAIIAAITFTGCASIQTSRDIPLKSTFKQLYRQRNIVNVNDCSNKAGRYCRELRKHGYQADVVVIDMRGTRKSTLHAVVKVGKDQYVDPTWGRTTKNLASLGDYRFTIKGDQLDQYGAAYR